MKIQLLYFKEIYIYRQLLFSLVRKDLKTRYKGSVLGFLWTFIKPLLQLLIYSTVFSFLLRNTEKHFFLFLFIGLLPWIMFVESMSVSTRCIVDSSNLVKKIYFPRYFIPISIVTANLVNYLYSFFILIPSLIFFGVKLSPIAFLSIIPIMVLYFITIGFALIVSSLYVRFRDLDHIVNIALMAWFYLTPIVYPINIVPENILKFMKLNPLVGILICIRSTLFYNDIFNFKDLIYPLISAFFLLIIGILLFTIRQKTFAEDL